MSCSVLGQQWREEDAERLQVLQDRPGRCPRLNARLRLHRPARQSQRRSRLVNF